MEIKSNVGDGRECKGMNFREAELVKHTISRWFGHVKRTH